MSNYGYNGKFKESGSETPLPGKCGRKLRNTDPQRYCAKEPVEGRDCCRIHGGNTLKGIDHPRYREGRYSRHLPQGLAEAYERALNDDDLTSLRDDLALIESRQVELLKQLKETQPVPWERVTKAFDRLEGDILNERDTSASVETLRELLDKGRTAAEVHEQAWDQIGQQVDRKARVATIEHKRLQDLSCTLTADQAMALLHGFLSAGREFIKDPLEYKHFTVRVMSYMPEHKQEPIVIEAKEIK